MDRQIKARLTWVKRYNESGVQSLSDQRRRPHNSPNKKINQQIIKWISYSRVQRNLGARRIQSELLRLNECKLSLATIHKILKNLDVSCT